MPTARELLEQADALMRRNRKRGRDRDGGPPTLTDALGMQQHGVLAPTVILPEAARAEATAADALAAADPIALDTLSDLPVLTDVVDVWPAASPVTLRSHQSDAPPRGLNEALEADALAASGDAASARADASTIDAFAARVDGSAMTADAAESPAETPAAPPEAAAVPAEPLETAIESAGKGIGADDERHASPPAQPDAFDEEFILEIPPASDPEPSPASAAVEAQPTFAAPAAAIVQPASPVLPGSLDWEAMAEEIRMQVLQRLDLFTDTGMRDQLGARLQPIVDRASAELVETINQQLGELVRGYVAEAIEREIESWRKRGE